MNDYIVLANNDLYLVELGENRYDLVRGAEIKAKNFDPSRGIIGPVEPCGDEPRGSEERSYICPNLTVIIWNCATKNVRISED